MIQVFEAMGDFISEENFYEWAMPLLKRIATELRERHPDVPLLCFTRGATYSSVALQQVPPPCPLRPQAPCSVRGRLHVPRRAQGHGQLCRRLVPHHTHGLAC